MKIVVLDSYAAVSTDLSLQCMEKLCDSMEVYDRTAPEDVVSRIGSAEIVLINKTVLRAETLAQCPNVRYIGLFATGYNVVDIDYCRSRGIVVSNAPAYSTSSVAQYVFAYALHFYSMVGDHDARVHAGEWQNCKDFAFYDPRISELAGKTIGIVGFGSIGRKVAQIAQAFDMKVLVHTRTPHPEEENDCLCFVPLDVLLQKSDIVTLHCPLFAETERLINRDALAKMKPSALLINTARGGILDEQAVADALNSGRIRGAAVDVATVEPIPADCPLLTAKNCVITPHIAWAVREARERLIGIVCDNVRAFLAGAPVNNVAEK